MMKTDFRGAFLVLMGVPGILAFLLGLEMNCDILPLSGQHCAVLHDATEEPRSQDRDIGKKEEASQLMHMLSELRSVLLEINRAIDDLNRASEALKSAVREMNRVLSQMTQLLTRMEQFFEELARWCVVALVALAGLFLLNFVTLWVRLRS